MRRFPAYLLRWFPELERFKMEAERKAAWRKSMSPAVAILYAIVFLAPLTCLSVWIRRNVLNLVDVPWWVGPVVSGATVGGCMTTGVIWLERRRIRRSLRNQLNERGIRVCMKCGYDLCGLPEPRCPECGTAFDREPSGGKD